MIAAMILSLIVGFALGIVIDACFISPASYYNED